VGCSKKPCGRPKAYVLGVLAFPFILFRAIIVPVIESVDREYYTHAQIFVSGVVVVILLVFRLGIEQERELEEPGPNRELEERRPDSGTQTRQWNAGDAFLSNAEERELEEPEPFYLNRIEAKRTMGIMDSLGFDLTVKLPRYVVVHNNPLAVLHKLMLLGISFMILYFAYSYNKHLKVVVPQGYPHMWTETGSGYKDLITSQKTSTWCSAGSRRKYDYYWDSTWEYSDISCVDPSYWKDGALPSPESQAYFPTYYEVSWSEHATGETDCTALQSSCTEHANCGTATAGPPGRQCFTDRPGGSGTDEGVCSCNRAKKDKFVLGTEAMLLAMFHMFSLTKDDGSVVQGYNTLTEAQGAGIDENLPALLTIIQSYDEDTLQWKEASCPGVRRNHYADAKSEVNPANECRFEPGATIKLSVQDWLRAAGIDGLDQLNKRVRKNLQAGTTVTVDAVDYTLQVYPLLRLTGVQIILQLEYMDPYFHDEEFEGIVCYIKVEANRTWTGRHRTRYEGSLPDDDEKEASGKFRRKYFEGVHFMVINSEQSRFGWPDPVQFFTYIAVTIVFLQVATHVILFIALYLLGNTSRNYQRVHRETVRTSKSATRDFPTRMMMAATSFFQLAHLERLGQQAEEIVPGFTERMHQEHDSAIDGMTISKKTVERMLRCAFSAVGDITEHDMKDMVDAVWSEMSSDNQSVHLVEFLEIASSNEYVDFIAAQRAFDQNRSLGCLERVMGDNVIQSKHGSVHKLMNFVTSAGGLVDDDDDDKEGEELRAQLQQKIAMRNRRTVVNSNGTVIRFRGSDGTSPMRSSYLQENAKVVPNPSSLSSSGSSTS
jgi:hypothetical protein